MTHADLAIRVLGGDASKLAASAVATLRAELGREPAGDEIRAVMSLLAGFHGEMARYAGLANIAMNRSAQTWDGCAARRAAWLAMSIEHRSFLRMRDANEGHDVPRDEMRIPCSCGAKEYEPCR